MVVSIGLKLFQLGGEYLSDLVGWEAGASSCQEGMDASGHVMSWRDWVNLDLETKGLG